MNKVLEKFKRYLNKEAERIKNSFFEEASQYKLDHTINISFPLLNQGLKNSQEYLDDLREKYEFIQKKEISKLVKIDILLDSVRENDFFTYFSLLQKYLDKFNFSLEEQAEIIAAYINCNINYFNLFNFAENEEGIKIAILSELPSDSMILKSERAKKRYLKRKVQDFIKTHQVYKRAVSNFRIFIGAEGIILPCETAYEFKDILLGLDLGLSEKQVDLVLSTSVDKDTKIKAEKREEEKREAERLLRIEREAANRAADAEAQKNLRQMQRNAIQELKKYINEDFPIRFIGFEEMEKVLSLLKQAGYLEEQISRIKKAIAANNNRLLKNEIDSKLELAKQTYLSVEQNEIIANALRIINDLDAVINPLYCKIKNDYELIIEQLISLSDVDVQDPTFNDDTELLFISIEDLREAIINYNYSDYRFTRLIEKKDN